MAMRLLLDEGTTDEFISLLSEVDVHHLREHNWTGLKNGELLDAAAASGFTALLTVDK
jgi:hypothetical protein